MLKEEAIKIIKDYNQWLDVKNKGQVEHSLKYRGCKMEHMACTEYDIPTIYEG